MGPSLLRLLQQGVIVPELEIPRVKPYQNSLCELIRQFTPDAKIGAEIGVWRGHTARVMLTRFRNLFLHLVDAYSDEHMFKSFSVEGMAEAEQEAKHWLNPYYVRCRFLKCLSTEAARRVWPGSLDFVFLDASHYYEDVKTDIMLWTANVRKGGLVMGHDYDARGDNMRRNPFGVKRAVDEYVKESRAKLILRRGSIWAFVK